MNKPYKIFIMGPQGSGKGTQSQQLSDYFNIPALSMGQLLRDEAASGSDLGKKINKIISAGDLVDDQLAVKILKKRLDQADTKNGFILDGYPRNLEQYKISSFVKPTHVIVVDIPKQESLDRLSGRLTCDKCGEVYSVKDDYKEGGKCGECDGVLIVRDDDKLEFIEKRLKIYHDETESMLKEYEKEGIVYKVDGIGDVDKVQERVRGIFESNI